MRLSSLSALTCLALASAHCRSSVTPAAVAAQDSGLGSAIADGLLTRWRNLRRRDELGPEVRTLVQYSPDSSGQPALRAWRVESSGTQRRAQLIAPDSAKGLRSIEAHEVRVFFGIDSVVGERAYVIVKQADRCGSGKRQSVTMIRGSSGWQVTDVTGTEYWDAFNCS